MKFLILDRDGTINLDKGYVYKVEDMEFLPGVVGGLKKFQNSGFKFIVITNQAGIARKIYAESDMHKFHDKMADELRKFGIEIEAFLFCPHHPDITGECICRKPKTGLIKSAEQRFGFNASKAIFIGDKDLDIELGKNCGGLTVLIENDRYPNEVKPDFKANSLSNAFDQLREAKLV